MVFFNELFQTVGLSKWNLYFDTPSDTFLQLLLKNTEKNALDFSCPECRNTLPNYWRLR